MSTEVATPLAETLKKKPNRRFSSVKGGFDAAQVDAFLVAIASSIEALQAQAKEAEVAPPPPAEVAAEGSSRAIERVGEVVAREIEKMLAEARGEAAAIVAQAGEEAEGIRKDAEGHAARSLEEASRYLTQVDADARRIPSDAAERRQQMIEETQKMQERLLRIATELDLVVKGD